MKKMNKLFTTVFFSVSAILASHSHVVYAAQTSAYKCTTVIKYQDFACAKEQQTQVLTLEAVSSSTNPGLRAQEIKNLDYLRDRLKLERELQNRLAIAKLNSDANTKPNITEIYLQHKLNTITQNSLTITIP